MEDLQLGRLEECSLSRLLDAAAFTNCFAYLLTYFKYISVHFCFNSLLAYYGLFLRTVLLRCLCP
jgi:hypothetical protein